ncbi:TPA: accessory Sec system protein Asp3 [Staphylococcus pseudintermedius]|nr:accessory Sec system protein Asp3 [Staphylococcus pseudintermedius]
MSDKHPFNIRWTHVTKDTFMYGTKLKWSSTGVLFENALMPSGIVIHEWKMMTDFQTDVNVPDLPILKKNCTYHFYFDYDVQPENSIYFKVIFKRRNGTTCGFQIIKTHEADVTVPEDTFSYVIQMINAASIQLMFRQITIKEARLEIHRKDGVRISSMQNPNVNVARTTLIFAPKEGLDSELIKGIQNCMLVTGWDVKASTYEITHLVEMIKEKTKGYRCQLVGYDKRSNKMAKLIGSHLKATIFVTSDTDNAQENAPNIHDAKDSTIVIYQGNETVTQSCQWLDAVLNKSHQLRGLNVQRLNGGQIE